MTTSIESREDVSPGILELVLRPVPLLLLALFFGWLSIVVYYGKDSYWANAQARVQRDAIRKEIAGLANHPWAGEYGRGPRDNSEFLLAPEAGYLFEWRSCSGIADRKYGKVTVERDRIRLTFPYLDELSKSSWLSSELVPVMLGQRHYLIPPDELEEFCTRAAPCVDPTTVFWRYFLRKGDENLPANGELRVPKEFQHYLTPKPVSAKTPQAAPRAGS